MAKKNKKEGFFSKLKNQIVAGVGVLLTTLGTVFIDEVKSFIVRNRKLKLKLL